MTELKESEKNKLKYAPKNLDGIKDLLRKVISAVPGISTIFPFRFSHSRVLCALLHIAGEEPH